MDPMKFKYVRRGCRTTHRGGDLPGIGMSEASLHEYRVRVLGDMVMKSQTDILYNTVHTHDFRMDYFRFGTGEKTMVILPGLSVQSVMNSAEAVAEEYKIFAEDYTVYVFDRRGDLPETYAVREMAEDTAEAFRILGLRSVDLFGASQGGMIALVMAQDHPDLAGNLVLGSSACRVTDRQFGTIAEWIAFAERGDARGLYLSFGEKLYPKAVFEQYREILAGLVGTVTENELRNFVILARGMEDFDVSDQMDRIQCPVLALEADDDRVLGAEAGALINKRMKERPDFSYHVYSGFGHAAFDTAAPEYQERIFRFFAQHGH